MSNAKLGFGAKLKRGDGGGPEVFTDIAELTSLDGPNLSSDTVDVTNLDSVGGYREHLPGLIDGGEVSCEMNWIPSNAAQAGMRADLEGRVKRNFKIVWPTSPNVTAAFSAYVTAFSTKTPMDGAMTASATLKITGPITWS